VTHNKRFNRLSAEPNAWWQRVVARPNAETVLCQLPSWIAHYNEVHPHKALGYRSPREFIATYDLSVVEGERHPAAPA
jgi:transposase InsO family protein